MKKKILGLIAILLVVTLPLAGCTGSASSADRVQTAANITVSEVLKDLGVQDEALLRRFDFTIGEALNNTDGVTENILVCDILDAWEEIDGYPLFNDEIYDGFVGITLSGAIVNVRRMNLDALLEFMFAISPNEEGLFGSATVGDLIDDPYVTMGDVTVVEFLSACGGLDQHLLDLFDGVLLADYVKNPAQSLSDKQFLDVIALLSDYDAEQLSLFEGVTVGELMTNPTRQMRQFTLVELFTAMGADDQEFFALIEDITFGDLIDDGADAFNHIKLKKVMQYIGLENEKLYDIVGNTNLGDWSDHTEETVRSIRLRDVLEWIGVEDAGILRRAGTVTIGELVEPPVVEVVMAILDPFKLNACRATPTKANIC